MSDYSIGPFGDRIEKLLEDLASRCRTLLDSTRSRPEILWHYTSTDGVREILSNGRVRLSHARFLNDPTEIAFGWERVTPRLDAEIARGDKLVAFFEMVRSIAADVYNARHYFIFCLSERPDSLNQWRAYGAGGSGFALGFHAPTITSVAAPKMEASLLRLIYSDKEHDELLNHSIMAVRIFFGELLTEQIPEEHKLGVLHRASVLLSDFLMRAALSRKHDSYEDEREWRLLVSVPAKPLDDDDRKILDRIEFRSGPGIVKPFIDIPTAAERLLLPIKRIKLGPTLRPVSTRASIELFLERLGYRDVEVEESGVPLQP